jgi:hypothetical protein
MNRSSVKYDNRCKLQNTVLWHATAQAVSRWLPTVAPRVRARFRSCGICGGQSGTEAGFLRVLRFPLSIFIPTIAPQSPSYVIWGWYNGPIVAAVPSGLSFTPLIIKKIMNTNHVVFVSSFPSYYLMVSRYLWKTGFIWIISLKWCGNEL